jgi:26S proteasome regulatory subunit N10
MNLTSGVQVAQLALKHRQNKHQRQRIVLFAGRLVFSVAHVNQGVGKKKLTGFCLGSLR